MNEGKKTGIFWIAGAVMLGIGGLLSWQPSNDSDISTSEINQPLFADFKDPLSAASMKIVTFDEAQGTLQTFEVRKDRETGAWTIPSREGYPADAVAQMKDAANVFVGRNILDTIMANPADHSGFGVVEPNLEQLNVGDEGVGRLVTFKDQDQKTLSSLIIGDPVQDQEGQIYVRKPGQDAVYAVSLDPKPLTTKFQDWIEDDLLKLTSIDIERMEIKEYTTSLGPRGIDWQRKYDATVIMDGSQWTLESLKEYDPDDPFAEPTVVEVGEDKKLDATKLNEIKNALDDVKIADVRRKPEGMSANLKADKKLAADEKAMQSLAQRGFYPVPLTAGGEPEILSANGELVVGLKDGVEYVLRFGNISGLSEQEDSDDESEDQESASAGVNRYLLVTTRVNEARIPRPELREIPQTLEDLEPKKEVVEEPAKDEVKKPADDATADPKEADAEKTEPAKTEPEKTEPEKADSNEKGEPADATGEKTEQGEAEADKPEDKAAETKAAEDSAEAPVEKSGEAEASGSGEGSGSGQGQNPDDQDASDGAADEPKADEPKADEPKADEPKADEPKADEPKADEPKADEPKADEPKADEPKADEPKADEPKADEPKADEPKADEPKADDVKLVEPANADKDGEASEKVEPVVELTEEEKQERLEAEQEKITKENQRLMDERKDKIDIAKRRVRELNARFADWYYVIPETTYSKLRIKREELFESEKKDGEAAAEGPGIPGLGFPPGGIPGSPLGPTNP